MTKNTLWKFLDDSGTFLAKNPHKLRRLYFPLMNEKGMLSSITPTLHGDIKRDIDSFLTVPQTTEDLKETRFNRNFWIYIKNKGVWSAASGEADDVVVEAGTLWHKLIRINRRLGLKVEFINFMPITDDTVEIMSIEITNISEEGITFTPSIAIPIYGRSLDRLHDHRHVSSLLNRIKVTQNGVIVTPTMVFNERGHKINKTSYFVLGCEENGKKPIGSFPTLLEFTGEGGNLETPEAITKDLSPDKACRIVRDGKEAIGAIKFRALTLPSNRSKKYIAIMGITETQKPERIFSKFNSQKKFAFYLSQNKKFWEEKIQAISFTTYDKDFDRWLKWVAIQPTLRRAFGCSFLPDFDYGRGGRGWRDLWQDSLTLILTEPIDMRESLINYFGGVREDGSNATIIGRNKLEFIPDRNEIKRVWMDHGFWPFMTLKLYIDQTGDTAILSKKAPYFESKNRDSILNHILRQHRRPFTKIGRHKNFLLEGGDWNDGLDMAKEKGESIAFTAAYSWNLEELSNLLENINYNKKTVSDLRKKAGSIRENIRKNEWLKTKSGYSFFNGYYDNLSRRVEGDHRKGVRMTLTGQVFPIMSGIATDYQIKQIYRSAKKYLWDKRLCGFRLNTDVGEIYPALGRAFGFAYGEKENGAFFSHMNVMFAYALYKRNFAREGFEVLNSIYKMCLNTELSKIYPSIPEYFNSDGQGMYSYLTGSSSWFILTLLTRAFGVRGHMGNLLIEPKLVKEQFKNSETLSVDTYFAGRKIRVNYINPKKLDFGEYKVEKVVINKTNIPKTIIERSLFLKLTSKSSQNIIDVHIVKS